MPSSGINDRQIDIRWLARGQPTSNKVSLFIDELYGDVLGGCRIIFFCTTNIISFECGVGGEGMVAVHLEAQGEEGVVELLAMEDRLLGIRRVSCGS